MCHFLDRTLSQFYTGYTEPEGGFPASFVALG